MIWIAGDVWRFYGLADFPEGRGTHPVVRHCCDAL